MGEAEAPKRVKGGRPRKHAPNAKRPTMAFRISERLHRALLASSAQNERSLSEEIERILEAHFLGNDLKAIIRQELRSASRSPVAERFLAEQPEPYINQSAPPH